jgi:two-component system, OmpR family, osmolarity sensor histidine kinase EnvZ
MKKLMLRLVPKSLVARTALVIVFALIASQVVSVLLFRYYSQLPRFNLVAIGYISHLKTIRAALDSIPPAQHRDFILKLREERGIRVIPPQRIAEEPLDPAPNTPAIRAARERLREQFGPEADIFVFQRPQRAARALAAQAQQGQDGKAPGPPPAAFITKIPVGSTFYWVLFPQSRIVEQDFSIAWIGWGVFGGVLALAAALFLVGRVNRPLQALANAAKEIGRGKHPPPVTEMGPVEVKAVAVAFNQMRENLTRQDQERATFLAGVSHDLRTPLSRLRLGLEMLPADPATRADMEKDIEDINGVIGQFMDFAREEQNETLESIDLNLLVRAAAERAERAGARITLKLDSHATLKMRPLAIKRLIGNLLDNARKHAGEDIEITTAREGNRIVLEVRDRGPGIPPADVERLKQPFTRMDAARTGQSGAGLGLAIIDRIAKAHGAQFDLLPREGGGTKAKISFPLAGATA